MPSYPYPVKESNHPQSEVRYYYCSESKKIDKSSYPHGTILNTKKEVVLRPSVYVTTVRSKSENLVRHKLVDGTIVNFYYMNGIWRMGTRNSWDVSFIEEFPNLDNNNLFKEAIDQCGYSFDTKDLDPTRMHTFLFSNPRCHIFSNEYRVWSYDPNYEFAGQPELAGENDGCYVEFDQETGELYPVQTELWKSITDMLYTNRMKIIEQELKHDNAVVKLILRPMFPSSIHSKRNLELDVVKNFMEEHLNDQGKRLYKIIIDKIEKFNNHIKTNVMVFEGVKLPLHMISGLVDFECVTDNFANKKLIIRLVFDELKKMNSE